MMKSRFVSAFAVAALIGLAACGGEEEPEVLVEEPVVEEPIAEPIVEEPVVEPAVVDTVAAAEAAAEPETGM